MRLCRITTKNKQVYITPIIGSFTQTTRYLTSNQIIACLGSGAIVEHVDERGNVIDNITMSNIYTTTTPSTVTEDEPELEVEDDNDISEYVESDFDFVADAIDREN